MNWAYNWPWVNNDFQHSLYPHISLVGCLFILAELALRLNWSVEIKFKILFVYKFVISKTHLGRAKSIKNMNF